MKIIAPAGILILVALALILTGCVGAQQQVVVTEPAYSHDGGHIVFVSNQDGDADLYLIKPDGSDLQQLTANKAIDVSPTWAPDDKTIVFVSNRSGSFELYRMNSDGTNVQVIPVNFGGGGGQ